MYTKAYEIKKGSYTDRYHIDHCPRYPHMWACWVTTDRPSGNWWTMKRFSTKAEWVTALLAVGAIEVTL